MWLFQAPLLPEALLAAHDFEAIDKAFTDAGQMGVQSPGESLLPLKQTVPLVGGGGQGLR